MAEFITGREIIAAAKKASTWRTAASLGSDDGILITGESLGAKAPTYLPDDSLGNADIFDMVRTSEKVAGSVTGYLRYEGWDVLMALALGTAGTPTQDNGTAYYNTYSPADSIADIFGTFAIKKAGTAHGIWEVPSFMSTGFTISGAIGSLTTITVNMEGNKIETSSPVNSDLSSVTYPDKEHLLIMDSSFKMRMNSQSGGALADSDKIYPSSFEITYNRPFADNFEAGYSDMSQPIQSNFAEATIRLAFDKYNLDTFMDAINDDADQKMDILFEGTTISGSTSKYTFRIDLPKITWTSAAANVGGPGTIPHEIEGRLLAVTSAPTGMTGVTDPLSIYVINTRSTDPLA